MTIAAELADLQRRHRALDEEIADAVSYYLNEDLMISELKRRRLHIKMEIERLRATTNHHQNTMIEKSA